MKISELYNKKQVLAFEIFPPKKTDSIDTIYNTLDELKELKPDYISVTFGAGGSDSDNKTCKIASDIKHQYGIESVAHLTCLHYTKEQIYNILSELKQNDIENILALRGDENPQLRAQNDFKYASELVELIVKNGNFFVSGACYPEGHIDSINFDSDISNLKKKVDAGAGSLISQLFFDTETFYYFRERATKAGINVPIEAGIMPVTNKSRIEKMVSLCGSTIPPKLKRIIDRYADSPEALKEAGISYATEQIVELLSNDVDGIHLYTMNNAYVAKRICGYIGQLFTTSK